MLTEDYTIHYNVQKECYTVSCDVSDDNGFIKKIDIIHAFKTPEAARRWIELSIKYFKLSQELKAIKEAPVKEQHVVYSH